MRTILIYLALVLSLAPALAQNTRSIPLTPAAWDFGDAEAEFVTHLGQKALRIDDRGGEATNRKLLSVKDLKFSNGTIEYDITFRENTGFAAVHFRRKDAKNSEHFYIRRFWAKDPQINTAVQYAAVLKGVNLWDVSEAYQSNATLKETDWNHVKLVVRDQQLLVYVNDMETPTLYVPMMDGDWASGALAFDGSAYLANVKVTPDATPGLSAGAGYDPVHNDPRYLREWEVSDIQDFPQGKEPTLDDLPGENTKWRTVSASHHGLVNLSRIYGGGTRVDRRIVWLKTTLSVSRDMVRKLNFGFSDEAYVYLNGAPLFVGKNLYGTPAALAPRGRASLENASFELPLKEGENEVMIGLTNFFFGWGLVARLADSEGVRY
ncbi:MAG: hypothetical protein AAF597_05750 [Bacteroidota bacterium]